MSATANAAGEFYLIQLEPEAMPERIKVGWATSVPNRIKNHRVTCPNLRLVKTWPCLFGWECAVLELVTELSDKRYRNEVYDCRDLERLVRVVTVMVNHTYEVIRLGFGPHLVRRAVAGAQMLTVDREALRGEHGISLTEAANHLGVKRTTFCLWVREGRIPSWVTRGRKLMVSRLDVEAFRKDARYRRYLERMGSGPSASGAAEWSGYRIVGTHRVSKAGA